MVARVYAKDCDIRYAYTDILEDRKISMERGWDIDKKPKEVYKLVGGPDNISKCYVSHHHISGGSGYRSNVYEDYIIIGDREDNHIELKGVILHEIASAVFHTLDLKEMKDCVELLTARIKRREEDRKNGKW